MAKGIPPTVSNFVAVLQSMLTQYDQKLASRERSVNIYRLGHFLAAAAMVEEDMMRTGRINETMTLDAAEIMSTSLHHHFTPGFPPVKKVIKQLEAFLTSGKNPSLVG